MRIVPIGTTIILTEQDQQLARTEAARRDRANRAANTESRRVSREPDEKISLDGAAGEIAFCRIFGVEPPVGKNDWAICDATLPPHGTTIDVKTRPFSHYDLAVHLGKAEKAGPDGYALMIGVFPGPYRFCGFISRAELIRPERIGWPGGKERPGLKKCYLASQKELTAEIPVVLLRVSHG